MNVENIVINLDKEIERVKSSLRNIEQLKQELLKASVDDWDWVTVKNGANLLDCSVGFIYNKINENKLSTKHFGSKIYVRISELRSIDDL